MAERTTEHAGTDKLGENGGHVDVIAIRRFQFNAKTIAHGFDGCLRGGVGAQTGGGDQRDERRHVHDIGDLLVH